jgi:hypothetical protein
MTVMTRFREGRGRAFALLLDGLVMGALLACPRQAESSPQGGLVDVPAVAVCVTSGQVEKQGSELHVRAKGMRGVVNDDHSSQAELVFRYGGPAKVQEPLANGEARVQVGLKLRARDTCNVVYVMWHMAPDQGVAVSVKSNPAKHTHEECGATGYLNKKARLQKAAPFVETGSTHVLHAAIDGTTLRVRADGVLVWEGELGDAAFAFDGPVGVRTDNAEADLALRVPGRHGPWRGCPLPR